MTDREKILNAVRQNQPELVPAPDLPALRASASADIDIFKKTLAGIGGQTVAVNDVREIGRYIEENFKGRVLSYLPERIFGTVPLLVGTGRDLSLREGESPIPALSLYKSNLTSPDPDPHQYADLEVAVIPAAFGVAENGAVWVTDKNLIHRAVPFICEHLAVVLKAEDVVPTMREAYERIGADDYGFGVFIAGPSKTADIEQSLVLGAHGAKTLTLFILNG